MLKSKEVRQKNYFVLYDSEDNSTYFDSFEELSKCINYKLNKLVYEFNRSNTNIINIVIDNKKYQLATFC